MARMSRDIPDTADLGLVAALTEHARTEVADLAAQLGMRDRQVRERLRSLERSGVIRGYHAVVSERSGAAKPALVMLRFTAGHRPSAEELCGLPGVRRVHALCTDWDFMVELDDCALLPLSQSTAGRGHARLLGGDADFEVFRVSEDITCASRAVPRQRYASPPPA